MQRPWPGEIKPGLLLLDKPSGMTSFDVIRRLRSFTGVRKFGHAGTLDPAATGLMVLGVESGTKQLSQYIHQDKVYEAKILLGQSRTTDDMDGEVVQRQPGCVVHDAQVASALTSLVGEQNLPVSVYSAIKRNGKPMYKRARHAAQGGKPIDDVPIRNMHVYAVQFRSLQYITIAGETFPVISVTFSVAAGTYIRSLAVAVGERLGCPATLYGLRRTQIGEFSLEQAASLAAYKRRT